MKKNRNILYLLLALINLTGCSYNVVSNYQVIKENDFYSEYQGKIKQNTNVIYDIEYLQTLKNGEYLFSNEKCIFKCKINDFNPSFNQKYTFYFSDDFEHYFYDFKVQDYPSTLKIESYTARTLEKYVLKICTWADTFNRYNDGIDVTEYKYSETIFSISSYSIENNVSVYDFVRKIQLNSDLYFSNGNYNLYTDYYNMNNPISNEELSNMHSDFILFSNKKITEYCEIMPC